MCIRDSISTVYSLLNGIHNQIYSNFFSAQSKFYLIHSTMLLNRDHSRDRTPGLVVDSLCPLPSNQTTFLIICNFSFCLDKYSASLMFPQIDLYLCKTENVFILFLSFLFFRLIPKDKSQADLGQAPFSCMECCEESHSKAGRRRRKRRHSGEKE